MSQRNKPIHESLMRAKRRDRTKFVVRAIVGLVVLNVVLLAANVVFWSTYEPKAYFGANWEDASFDPDTKRQWLEEALKDHLVKPAAQ